MDLGDTWKRLSSGHRSGYIHGIFGRGDESDDEGDLREASSNALSGINDPLASDTPGMHHNKQEPRTSLPQDKRPTQSDTVRATPETFVTDSGGYSRHMKQGKRLREQDDEYTKVVVDKAQHANHLQTDEPPARMVPVAVEHSTEHDLPDIPREDSLLGRNRPRARRSSCPGHFSDDIPARHDSGSTMSSPGRQPLLASSVTRSGAVYHLPEGLLRRGQAQLREAPPPSGREATQASGLFRPRTPGKAGSGSPRGDGPEMPTASSSQALGGNNASFPSIGTINPPPQFPTSALSPNTIIQGDDDLDADGLDESLNPKGIGQHGNNSATNPEDRASSPERMTRDCKPQLPMPDAKLEHAKNAHTHKHDSIYEPGIFKLPQANCLTPDEHDHDSSDTKGANTKGSTSESPLDSPQNKHSAEWLRLEAGDRALGLGRHPSLGVGMALQGPNNGRHKMKPPDNVEQGGWLKEARKSLRGLQKGSNEHFSPRDSPLPREPSSHPAGSRNESPIRSPVARREDRASQYMPPSDATGQAASNPESDSNVPPKGRHTSSTDITNSITENGVAVVPGIQDHGPSYQHSIDLQPPFESQNPSSLDLKDSSPTADQVLPKPASAADVPSRGRRNTSTEDFGSPGRNNVDGMIPGNDEDSSTQPSGADWHPHVEEQSHNPSFSDAQDGNVPTNLYAGHEESTDDLQHTSAGGNSSPITRLPPHKIPTTCDDDCSICPGSLSQPPDESQPGRPFSSGSEQASADPGHLDPATHIPPEGTCGSDPQSTNPLTMDKEALGIPEAHEHESTRSHDSHVQHPDESAIRDPSDSNVEASGPATSQHQDSLVSAPHTPPGGTPGSSDAPVDLYNGEARVISEPTQQDPRGLDSAGPQPSPESHSRDSSASDGKSAERSTGQDSTNLDPTPDNPTEGSHGNCIDWISSPNGKTQAEPVIENKGSTRQQGMETESPNQPQHDHTFSPNKQEGKHTDQSSTHPGPAPEDRIEKGNISTGSANSPKKPPSMRPETNGIPPSDQDVDLKHSMEAKNREPPSSNEVEAGPPNDEDSLNIEPSPGNSKEGSNSSTEPTRLPRTEERGPGIPETNDLPSNAEDGNTHTGPDPIHSLSQSDSSADEGHIAPSKPIDSSSASTEDPVMPRVHDASCNANDGSIPIGQHTDHSKSTPDTRSEGDDSSTVQSIGSPNVNVEDPGISAGEGTSDDKSPSHGKSSLEIPADRSHTSSADPINSPSVNNEDPALSGGRQTSYSNGEDRKPVAEQDPKHPQSVPEIPPDGSSIHGESISPPCLDNEDPVMPGVHDPSSSKRGEESIAIQPRPGQDEPTHETAAGENDIFPTNPSNSSDGEAPAEQEHGDCEPTPETQPDETNISTRPTSSSTTINSTGDPGAHDSFSSNTEDASSPAEPNLSESGSAPDIPSAESNTSVEPIGSPGTNIKGPATSECIDHHASPPYDGDATHTEPAPESPPAETNLPTEPISSPVPKGEAHPQISDSNSPNEPQMDSPSAPGPDPGVTPPSDDPRTSQNDPEDPISLEDALEELSNTVYETYIQEELIKALNEHMTPPLLGVFSNLSPRRKEEICEQVTNKVSAEIEELIGTVFSSCAESSS
ncbi:hypothetical protein BO78DRAFT_415859 [Aspergillus sclerotiicarbonarius CBS 121057]|uniref:Uncharacterized protein n=1 Tax=Aspergillus sclerotiicarbonarius (strain CBS 121057 / IBT 28362) TaxID=1448318 RepID=A0A319EI38_ASPSB|nr:hypothetical protein BO78DRAFT_415859 [Aspergillus sclerotiicarbonarius CBS 121057]